MRKEYDLSLYNLEYIIIPENKIVLPMKLEIGNSNIEEDLVPAKHSPIPLIYATD